MSIYTACKSGIIQRGEEIFPFRTWGVMKDWPSVGKRMQHIPRGGERLMSTDEVLELYD